MGIKDESWCAGCGTSLPYKDHDQSCGDCVGNALEGLIADFDKYLSDLLKEKQLFVVQDIRDKFNEMGRNA
jgi:Zn finger protein HypA/HybF involved in hydrogenase expression